MRSEEHTSELQSHSDRVCRLLLEKKKRIVVLFMDVSSIFSFFFFNDTATTEIYTLSLHDALPISMEVARPMWKSSLPQTSPLTAFAASITSSKRATWSMWTPCLCACCRDFR